MSFTIMTDKHHNPVELGERVRFRDWETNKEVYGKITRIISRAGFLSEYPAVSIWVEGSTENVIRFWDFEVMP